MNGRYGEKRRLMMRNVRYLLLLPLVISDMLAAAGPMVSPDSVILSENQATRQITVAYELRGEPAVVTIDIQTNSSSGSWISIGGTGIRIFRKSFPVNLGILP